MTPELHGDQSEPVTSGQPGLIFRPGPAGWWDSGRVSCPQVMRRADGSYQMWYYGRDTEFDPMIKIPSGRCGTAESDDGIHWRRLTGPLTMGSMFEPSPATSDAFDNSHVGISDLHYRDGLYWMWYFGGDQKIRARTTAMGTAESRGIEMLPGCAISRDGMNWVRLQGPYRGALLDHGGEDDWDALFGSWPRVIQTEDGKFIMYYHSLDWKRGGFFIGAAVSDDGLRWTKVGTVLGPGEPGAFDAMGGSCRHVIKHDDGYLMFYEGTDDSGYYGIGLALSDDGLNWRRDSVDGKPAGPVFNHAPKGLGRWDGRAIGAPCVLPMPDGSYRMYYIGANEAGPEESYSTYQIGMAVSDGPNYRSWRRWEE
jgi:beta-xylosidase